MNPQQNSLLPLLVMMSKASPRHIGQALSSGQPGALALQGAVNPYLFADMNKNDVPLDQSGSSISPDNPLLMLMGQGSRNAAER